MATKQENIDAPTSCWNKAGADEEVFVLLGRDKAMPATLRAWADQRCLLQLNNPWDESIVEARAKAAQIELQQQRAEALVKAALAGGNNA